jgi:hypothetical protein
MRNNAPALQYRQSWPHLVPVLTAKEQEPLPSNSGVLVIPVLPRIQGLSSRSPSAMNGTWTTNQMRPVRYKPAYSVLDILRMRSEGKTNPQIARRFGISSSRVQQIIAEGKRKASSAQRSAVLRHEIGARNDIARKLPIEVLFCVLNLPPRAETVLRRHFAEQMVNEFSLRDMMDLLIPLVERPTDLYHHMPAYRLKWLGLMLYGAMIKVMSAVDCGDALEAEWTERKTRLEDYLRATRGYYPYILHGKNPALAEP